MSLTKVTYSMIDGPTINVMDYGAVGNGVADDTVAFQSAIDYLAPIGGTLLIPNGTYKITSSLNWINPDDDGRPGIFFQGNGGTGGSNGGPVSIIKSYIANGPLFQIQGTKSFASGGSGSRFFNGGGMYGLYLDGTNATGTSQAIRVNGWQYGEISDITIFKFPGDGITQYSDPGYPNADYSASILRFKDCWILDNAGNGINQTSAVGAPSWQFNGVLFGWNGNGAVITSSSNSFIGCSFTGSGFSLNTSAPRGDGIHIKVGSSAASTNRLLIQGCELDYARAKHISLDYTQTAEIIQNRIIFNDRSATGSMTPPIGVDIASAGAGSNVTQVNIDKMAVRVDTVGTLSVFKISNTANVVGISVTDPIYSDGTGGLATITKYDGFETAGNRNVRNGYLVSENSAVVIPGKPAPFVLMSTLAGQTIGTSAFDTIVFETQETVNASIYPAGTSAGVIYNTSTGVFTAPVDGFYSISCTLNFASITSADTVRTQIVTAAGTTSTDFLGAATSSGITGFVLPTIKVYLKATNTVEVKARLAGTARSLSTTSGYASRLRVELVP